MANQADHTQEPPPDSRDRYWAWVRTVPPWAVLAVAVAAWGGTFAVCWVVRTISLFMYSLSPLASRGIWWGWNLALVGLAVALVPRPRSWLDRVAGPVLYAVAFGVPGAACYLVVRAAGLLTESRLAQQVWAVAEWLPDRAKELFGKPTQEPTQPAPSGRISVFVLAGAAAVALALYWPILGSGLKTTVTGEDHSYFQAAKRLGFWAWSEYFSCQFYFRYTEYPGAWFRPLQMLSYALDYVIWGDWVRGWHLTSVLLHLANAALLFWAVTLTARDRMAGLIAAVLYVILPTNGGAVCWISARVDPLAAFFSLGAVVCFALLFMGKSKWLWPAGVVLVGLALGSKETAAVAGAVVAAWAALASSGPRGLRWGVAATLTALVVGYGVARVVTGTIYIPAEYIYPGWQPYSLRWYLEALWKPAPQIVSALQMGSLGFDGEHLVALVAAVGLLRRNWRPAVLWFAWKAALLAPNVGFAAISAYREYVPNLGAAALSGLIASQALITMRSWPRPLRWIPIAVVAGFFVLFARDLPTFVAFWVE